MSPAAGGGVDVLAVLDRARDVLGDFYFKYQRRIGPYATQALASVHQLPKARIAVADLIEAIEADAADRAIAAGLGASEWRAFVPPNTAAALSNIEGGK